MAVIRWDLPSTCPEMPFTFPGPLGAGKSSVALRPRSLDFARAAALVPTEEGRAYISRCEIESPVRRARQSRFNGVLRQPSETMGFVLEAESLSIEAALLIEAEQASDCSKYYAQICQIPLDYVSVKGRRIRTAVTPDLLLLFKNGSACIVEGRRKSRMEGLAGDPARALRCTLSGRWRDPTVQAACERMGIGYVVVTEDEINHLLHSNLRHIRGSRRNHDPSRLEELVQEVRQYHFAWLHVLLSSDRWSPNEVYFALWSGAVVGPMTDQDLIAPMPFPVAATAEGLCLAMRALAEAPKGSVPPPTLRQKVSSAAQARAGQILAQIAPLLDDPGGLRAASKATRQHFRAFTKMGRGMPGIAAITPRYEDRGNRTPRLSHKVVALIEAQAQLDAVPNKPRATKGYGTLLKVCKSSGLEPPSRPTYYKWRKRILEEHRRERDGDVATYRGLQERPLTEMALAREPKRYFQSAQIDHTPMPFYCVRPMSGGKISRSPVVTRLIDVLTGCELGFYLTFGRPTVISIHACLIDCVRRHGRLPEELYFDGEKPHNATSVETVIAGKGLDKIGRRYARARDGSHVERAFQRDNDMLLRYLQGNYAGGFEGPHPASDSSVDPRQHAEWTVGGLYLAVDRYYHWWNANGTAPGGLGLTPQECATLSIRRDGMGGRAVDLTSASDQILLLPDASRGGIRVVSERAQVRVGPGRYVPRTPIPDLKPQSVAAVKFNPYDFRYILVRHGNEWREHLIRGFSRFERVDAATIAAITIEFWALIRAAASARNKRDESLADMIGALLNDVPRDPIQKVSQGMARSNLLPNEVDPWGAIDVSNLRTMEVFRIGDPK